MVTSPSPAKAQRIIDQYENQRRKVDFDNYDMSVQQLLAMLDADQIDVAPAYQRKFRWDNEKRSRLIESVMLGVPTPPLFMASNKDGTWEVVDGVQRLSTIAQFCGGEKLVEQLGLGHPLTLEGLEKLSAWNGSAFLGLPKPVQLKFLTKPIRVVTLSDKSDKIVRFDLFERLNTGGVALSNQEIRACVFRGQFNDFLERLAQNAEFTKVVRLSESQRSNRTAEEWVLRFFAFLSGYKKFEHSVIGFLNDYMKEASRHFDYKKQEELFVKTFSELLRLFPKGILRKRGKGTTPVNLFEGVAVGAALVVSRSKSLHNATEWLTSDELKKFTTGATNNPSSVVGRVEFCRDELSPK